MTSTHRTTTTAAVILSLAAAGTPTATATATASGTNPTTTGNQPPAAVYSRPDKTMIPVPPSHQSPAAVYSRPDKSMLPTSAPAGGDALPPAAPQAVVRIQTPPNGFDWGDAGIGAAGGLAFAMIGLGGALVISQRGPRRDRHTASHSSRTTARS
jgi:hypothetical protein